MGAKSVNDNLERVIRDDAECLVELKLSERIDLNWFLDVASGFSLFHNRYS
jgi:hypothetical protein